MEEEVHIDKIPLGHTAQTYWGEEEVTPQIIEKELIYMDREDPLEGISIQGTEFNIPDNLFEHQKEDVRTVAQSNRNYLILSEMGVGKTPEAISIAMVNQYKNVLVLVPKSLRLEWGRQVEQWTGQKPIICHRSSSKRLLPLIDEKLRPMLKGESTPPFFILNYDTMRKDSYRELLENIPWDLIIMDEVHHLRNLETKTTKKVLDFLDTQKKHSQVILMTGSPIVNSPLDFYTLLMMIDPVRYSRQNRFEWLNEYTYWTPQRGKPKIHGTKNTDQFKREIKPFSIQRKKEEVLQYLPEKLIRTATLEMEEDQQTIYDQMSSDLCIMLDDGEPFNASGILALLTRLRQLNLDPRLVNMTRSSSKTDFILDLVQEDTTQKIVIFTTFATYVELLSQDLNKLGITHVTFTGKTPADKVGEQVKQFQEDPTMQVALGTIKVMGEGITLTSASTVVLMDRWWTPSANNQAVDRLHRPGQHNSVNVILPSNDGSIDQNLDSVLNLKQSITDSLMDDNVMEEFMDSFRSTHSVKADYISGMRYSK